MRVPLLSVQKFLFTREASSNPSADPIDDLPNEVVGTIDINAAEKYASAIPGYFAVSTAPINTEDSDPPDPQVERSFQDAVDQIAAHLSQPCKDGDAAELVILIHGYNTSKESAENWYKSVFKYINRIDPYIQNRRNAVFIGYRWPSENMQFGAFTAALAAMPVVPRVMLRVEFIVGLMAAILLLAAEHFWADQALLLRMVVDGLLIGLLSLSTFLGAIFLSLLLLRLSAYFRDNYRATNYGVPDLVELIRALDYHLGDRPSNQKVKLTLVGHSMGGFVVTNAIRILSDVFDSRSIERHPSAEVGKAFCLERLILASPDIPVLTIAAGRANFLSSSLRRFGEAYLFSNQGDIVLRIASTAANYFSFPARSRSSGYRLGNMAIRANRYGIVNLDNLEAAYAPPNGTLKQPLEPALKQLFVTNLEVQDPLTKKSTPGLQKRSGLPDSLAKITQERFSVNVDKLSIADLFTFFDCTDYVDVTDRSPVETGVLSRARRKPVLGFLDYFKLTLDYGKAPQKGQIDVHGGYFEGKVTKQVIYRIAFLGFSELLRSLSDSSKEPVTASEVDPAELDTLCRSKGIKLLLSPLRYLVNIQQQDVSSVKDTLMDKIENML